MADHLQLLEQARTALANRPGFHWREISRIDPGSIIHAAFKHPNPKLKNTHPRYFLVISRDRVPSGEVYFRETLAVVSLETNTGRGRAAYEDTEQHRLRDIKLLEEGSTEEADSLYIRDWAPWDQHFTLKPDTVADMSTVILLFDADYASNIFCREVGTLTTDSYKKMMCFYPDLKVNRLYTYYLTTDTARKQRNRNATSAPAYNYGPPLPERTSGVAAVIFDPSREDHQYVSISPKALAQSAEDVRRTAQEVDQRYGTGIYEEFWGTTGPKSVAPFDNNQRRLLRGILGVKSQEDLS